MYESECYKLHAGMLTACSKLSKFSLQSKIPQSLAVDKCPCATGVEHKDSIRQALFQVTVTQHFLPVYLSTTQYDDGIHQLQKLLYLKVAGRL